MSSDPADRELALLVRHLTDSGRHQKARLKLKTWLFTSLLMRRCLIFIDSAWIWAFSDGFSMAFSPFPLASEPVVEDIRVEHALLNLGRLRALRYERNQFNAAARPVDGQMLDGKQGFFEASRPR